MWLWIILAVIILIIIYVFILYNSFISLDNKVKEAFSTMDVYLKKRWDLIPNLVETVKGYAKYEEETLTRVTKLRNTVYNEMTNDEKIINNEELASDVSKIMALKEACPELKANENIIMEQLESTIIKYKCFLIIFLLSYLVTNQKECLNLALKKNKI